jgi:hypothetical protein
MVKGIKMISSGRSFDEASYADLARRNVIVSVFDDLHVLFQHEKFFVAHPEIGLWLWFLLFQHAKGESSKVPAQVTRAMVGDAEAFLVRAIHVKPALKFKMLKIVSLSSTRVLAGYLPAAAQSAEIFSAFLEIAQSWREWDCSKLLLEPSDCFARLCSLSNVTVLKLHTAVGVNKKDMLALLSSDIHHTLQYLSLPSTLNDCSYMLQTTQEFPAMQTLVARDCPLNGKQAGQFVRLCPLLRKLDVSRTMVLPQDVAEWAPVSLQRLDLGFPREPWHPRELRCILESQRVSKSLEFVGLGGTAICDEHVQVILTTFPSIKALDLCKTFVSELYVRKLATKPSFPSSVRRIWMPQGYLYPCFSDDEVNVHCQIPQQITVNKSGSSSLLIMSRANRGLCIRPMCRDNIRSLHRELFGDAYFANLEHEKILYMIQMSGTAVRMVTDPGSEGELVARLQIMNSMMRPAMPPALLTEFVFEGETFSTASNFHQNGKVNSIAIKRKDTNESRSLLFHGGMRLSNYNIKCFAGVSPVVFLVMMHVLGAHRPVGFDQLFFN